MKPSSMGVNGEPALSTHRGPLRREGLCSRENVRVIVLCCIWYACSTLNGVFGKR